ncbi:hypothetical protein PRZ48_003296 [Zasmidium cellare]|uniref:NAD(P)-binding protein n=1 Tax=Zasmidium cellare TaxID=395010 RepID=A0ABR0EW83_ZASCE|nr:hypothetical protein PRZ48_003296 [Zasmidium cellare]
MNNIPEHTDLPKQYDVYPFIELSKFTGKLKGKVVCITGASSGIGRTTCLAFAHAGASVACVARRKDRLDALVDEIKQKYDTPVAAIPADLFDSKAPKQVIQSAESALGPIDILINNAGLQIVRKLVDVTDFEEEWWKLLTINLRAPAALTHAVLPSMIARNTGILINIGSTAGAHDIPWCSAYGSSKVAVMKLYQNLGSEVSQHGITTFNVHPGQIMTDMVIDAFVDAKERYAAEIPSEGGIQWQTVALAANTVLALCAEERCKALSGRYVDAEQDLEKVLEAVESGRVERERLYWIKVDEV